MRNKSHKLLFLFLSLLAVAVRPASLLADEGQFYIAPGIQWMNFDDRTLLHNDEGWFFGLGYDITDRWSVELSGFDLDPKTGSSTELDIDHWKIDLLYGLDFDIGPLDTFLVGGVGTFNVQGENGTALDIGAGVSYDLTDSITWRTAARRFSYRDRDGEDVDIGIETTLVFRFGGSRRSSPPAAVAVPQDPAPAAPVVVDTDGDGVPDNRDDCPDTPRNYAVDDRGCPIPVEEIARVELEINFEFDRSEVRPQYISEIQEIAEFMQQYSDVIVELEGHTDSDGDEDYNQGLSERRANAVRQVLIDQFNIQASRVTALGYGESRPVASNNNAAGKAQNRRVITVIIKTLQNYQPR